MSRAGRAVTGYLLGATAQPSRGTFRGPAGAAELLFRVFVVAVRRELARRPGHEAVTSFVAGAFARLGVEPDERSVQKGHELVRAALGQIEWADGAFTGDVGLIGWLLSDLVHTRGLDEAQIGMLVAAGEQRVRRLRKARRGGREPWWDRLFHRGPESGRAGGPRTITGYGLKALARFDIQAAHALPDDPLPQCATAVIENAFSIAVRERFGERPELDLDQVAAFAEGVSRLAKAPPVDAWDAQALILAEYATPVGEEPATAAEIRVLTFMKIVDDLGLFDPEIDDILIMAEGIAEEDGCPLSLLDKG